MRLAGVFGDRMYRVFEGQKTYLRCTACGSWRMDPLPEAEEIAFFYPGGYWHEHKKDNWLSHAQRVYQQTVLRRDVAPSLKWLAKGVPVVDLGCGRGDFLALLSGKGHLVSGIEMDARAVAFARSRGFEVIQGAVEGWKGEGCEALVAFHLLEHLRDPVGVLKRWSRSMTRGGLLVLRVPHVDSLQAKLLGSKWKGLEVPRHLHQFSSKGLHALAERTGWQVRWDTTWSLRDGPPAWASSWFPYGEPTYQEIQGRIKPVLQLLYLALNTLLTPLEWMASRVGQGAMYTGVWQVSDPNGSSSPLPPR